MALGSFFAKLFEKEAVGVEKKAAAKAISREAAEAAARRGSSAVVKNEVKTEARATAEAAARAAPVGVNTRTVAHTESPVKSAFSQQAARAVEAVPVKGVTKAVAYTGGAVVIGGGAYVLGKGAGSGLASIGYGWRDVTGNKTPEDTRKDQLDNYDRQIGLDRDALKNATDYANFLKQNQLGDSPSARDAFNSYFADPSRAAGGSTDQQQSSFGNSAKNVAIGAGLLALVGTGVYLAVKKKGGRKK